MRRTSQLVLYIPHGTLPEKEKSLPISVMFTLASLKLNLIKEGYKAEEELPRGPDKLSARVLGKDNTHRETERETGQAEDVATPWPLHQQGGGRGSSGPSLNLLPGNCLSLCPIQHLQDLLSSNQPAHCIAYQLISSPFRQSPFPTRLLSSGFLPTEIFHSGGKLPRPREISGSNQLKSLRKALKVATFAQLPPPSVGIYGVRMAAGRRFSGLLGCPHAVWRAAGFWFHEC